MHENGTKIMCACKHLDSLLTLQSCQKSDQHKARRWHPVQDYLFFYDIKKLRKYQVEFTLENKIK
jgi:hypothetical protein